MHRAFSNARAPRFRSGCARGGGSSAFRARWPWPSETRVGTTPCDVVYERARTGSCATGGRLRRDLGRAGAVLLRADQSALHPRPSAGQERGPAVSGPRIRRVHHRLGRAVARRIASLTLEHYVCGFLKEAVEFILAAARSRRPPSARLLHGRHDVRALRGASSRARQEPHPPGCAHRLRRPGVAPEPLDGPRALRRRRVHRRPRQLPRMVSPGLLPEHEAGPEPAAEVPLDVREPRGSHNSSPTTSRWSSGSTTTSPSPARRFACS